MPGDFRDETANRFVGLDSVRCGAPPSGLPERASVGSECMSSSSSCVIIVGGLVCVDYEEYLRFVWVYFKVSVMGTKLLVNFHRVASLKLFIHS